MRKNVFAVLALAGLVSIVAPMGRAHAQLNIDTSVLEPMTKLPPEKWVFMMTKFVNATNVIGKDAVYMVNATGEDIATVTCGDYQLVGPKPYITNNKNLSAPVSLPKWTVTVVPSETFNTYCKNGVDGTSNAGRYHGTLNAADHTFVNSTFVVFKPVGQ